jgi:hypothetical protein
MRIFSFVLCVVLCVAAGASGARADDAYFKGKRLTMVINFAAGGPTDIEGRLFARYLAKHIEGQPTIIVQNMEGAGGVTGAQYIGAIAPKDGTVFGYLSGVPWIYVNDPERWRVDLRSFEFLGFQSGTTVQFVRTDVSPGMKQATDIVKAQGLIAGGLSADTSKDLRTRLGLDMLGVPHQYVTGYRSGTPARLAMQRGEINMFSESVPGYRSLVEPVFITTGMAIPVWYDAVDDQAAVPKELAELSIWSFPKLYKAVKGTLPSGRLWDAYRTVFEMNSTMQRLIVMPPGAAPAAIMALRAALGRLNEDKAFAEEALKSISFAPDYEAGPDADDRIRRMLVASPEVRAFFADYIKNPPKR